MNNAEIRRLIAQNRLEAAINALMERTAGTDLHQAAVLVSSQLAEWKKQQIIAKESPAELERRRNQIAHGALQLLDELSKAPGTFAVLLYKYRWPLSLTMLLALACLAWRWGGPKIVDPAPPPVPAADSIAFYAALTGGNMPALDTFLLHFPDGPYAAKARRQKETMQQTLLFQLKAAETLYRGGQAGKAVEALKKAMEINPEDPDVKRLITLFKQ